MSTIHITSPYLEKEEPDQYGQSHPIETDRLLNVREFVISDRESSQKIVFLSCYCSHLLCGIKLRNYSFSSSCRIKLVVTTCKQTSLNLMDEEIEKLSRDEKKGLLEAHEKCPQVSKSDKHKIMFLRCEQFNADVSDSKE